MVKISALKPYIPYNPEEFSTNPYDVIEKQEELKLKETPNSLIHLILPDGEGEEIYQNAAKAYKRYKEEDLIYKEEIPSIFVYRQESEVFSQQGFILGLSLQDYEDGNIVKHEHTREKALKDRTKHILATNVAPGLVWSVYQSDSKINKIMEEIKKNKPKFEFKKFGYDHIIWQETNTKIIDKLKKLLKNKKVYIADGHHRAASAAEYRNIHLSNPDISHSDKAPWQFLLSYLASDDQTRILPYNRIIKKVTDTEATFLNKIRENFEIIPMDKAFNPASKNDIAMCLKGKWYKLIIKEKSFKNVVDSLDVSILQNEILNPILKIKDIRSDDNIFFSGGIQDPILLEKYIIKDGNDLLFNLYPVDIKDLERIADTGGVMPPKSTWFDPKVLSGLVLHDLSEG